MSNLAEMPSLEQGAPGAGVDVAELAQLMSVFNDVTSQLHETHDRLHQEVHRLRSELAEANDQLERSRRLAALGQMAAGIAHEVRNPLGCIQLYAQMLEQDLGDRPEQSDVAAKISKAVVGLDGVVGDVLTFARELVVRCSWIDAASLLERSCELACPAPHEFEVVCDVEETPISCDAKLLQQALVNLIRNAAEAMADGQAPGRLELGASVIADPERGGRRIAVLRVADTGPGMGQDVIDRMFNPFFTTRHTGTGLGLAIVHRIVDAHGGRIDVRSRTNEATCVDSEPRGTTIELHLPQPGEGDDANQQARMAE